MFARVSRRLVSVVVMASLIAGCAHHQPPPVADGGEYPRPVAVAEPPPPNPILEFCANYEWVCILAGMAVMGAAVAIIKNAGDDSDSQKR